MDGAVGHGTGVPHLAEADSHGAVGHELEVQHLAEADSHGAVALWDRSSTPL